MLIFSVIFYVGSLVGIILLYVFFTEVSAHSGYNQTICIVLACCTYFLFDQLASCTLNKVYISSTLILSVVVSIVAILPWVQKGTITFLIFIASFPGFCPLAAVQAMITVVEDWGQGSIHHTV